ncbi:B1 protein-like [Sitophilus oryzae]|uniref:B1 protein-like n=1 Tax=Sitophilus oryzae TaxID=7048 RepID=A0A6J2YLI0_SITOR|nr:B1 protein-like [Sitophilus oryzae]
MNSFIHDPPFTGTAKSSARKISLTPGFDRARVPADHRRDLNPILPSTQLQLLRIPEHFHYQLYSQLDNCAESLTIRIWTFSYKGQHINKLQVPPDQLQKLIKYNTECRQKSGAPMPMIMAAVQGKFDDDPALKTHFFCLGKKIGFMDKDGNFDREFIKEQMSQLVKDDDKIEEVLNKCLIQLDSPEETAFQSIKCMSDNRKTVLP